MLILEIKSALLCPRWASEILAPILVPQRKSCFERTYSFYSLVKYLYKLTILTAKSKLFWTETFVLITLSLILHFAFWILNFSFSYASLIVYVNLDIISHYHPLVNAEFSRKIALSALRKIRFDKKISKFNLYFGKTNRGCCTA